MTQALTTREILEQTLSYFQPVRSNVILEAGERPIVDVPWTKNTWFDGPEKDDDDDGTWYPGKAEEITQACSMGAMILAAHLELSWASSTQEEWLHLFKNDPNFARAVVLLSLAIRKINPEWAPMYDDLDVPTWQEWTYSLAYGYSTATFAGKSVRLDPEVYTALYQRVLHDLPAAAFAKDLVIRWNDDDDRTFPEVHEMFTHAIKMAIDEEAA